MNPTKEKTDLETLLESIGDITVDNPGVVSGAIDSGYSYGSTDTITLSGSPWSISNNTVIGGGYSYPNTVSVSGGPYTIGSTTGISQPWYSNKASGKIRLDGEDADIEVNGESLIAMIKRVEERLNILTPNEKLEAEWEELRELGDQYRKLEQHIKDKQATWDRLKAMPKVDID